MKYLLLSRALFCPHLGCDEVRRSQRRGAMDTLLKPALAPWRCETCGNRFYAFRWARPAPKTVASKQASA